MRQAALSRCFATPRILNEFYFRVLTVGALQTERPVGVQPRIVGFGYDTLVPALKILRVSVDASILRLAK